ncbi:STM4012 family radical SAM protein [Fulvivirgaceae bacterium PWU5]|uniref:STM4012 family radical SAM protein n=1 Tax=Dawidia cretensis TaxID=2782350 RepID=A0AAP2GRW2_9BACT|nr:STM4012 family radical SAM protein [Dawidia cretensis]MBT1710699.1 STM4012 family radical SAM protein [Dawidia cretensis]
MIAQADTITTNPYAGYAYSYPHKTAYREFSPARSLSDVWAREDKSSLFLYVHIPFCEMRCGFCNLFTMANPEQDQVAAYLQSLERQATVVSAALGEATYAQLAIGGGTPSFLHEHELEKLFAIIENTMRADTQRIPVSFEVSPKTITPDKLRYLHAKGVDRISMGVQSFFDNETKLLGRPQHRDEVHRALTSIKKEGFETMNIDMIYGGAGQTPESWQINLQTALEYEPEEIYLYPLYVRPLTGLDKMGLSWDNFRLERYRQGRDYLLEHGYDQVSMRMFRKKTASSLVNAVTYCCQEDGMVGLGSGARSYTQSVHYSTEYAVGRKGVKNIIGSYLQETSDEFGQVRYGISLPEDEQKRRDVIKSILHGDGLDLARYNRRFGANALAEFPELCQLLDAGMAVNAEGRLRLTKVGMELSDSIGPWLYSPGIQALMNQYELR